MGNSSADSGNDTATAPLNRRVRRVLMLLLPAAAVIGFLYLDAAPQRSQASSSGPLDNFVLYGINRQSADLLRYQFSNDSLINVGTISQSGLSMTGIDAAAYVPRNSNIFGFWNDPTDELTKLVYISALTGRGVPVGQDLGGGRVSAAVAVPATPLAQPPDSSTTPVVDIMQYGIYAVQQAPSMDYDIINGEVVPNEEFAVMITVLGAAISYGSYYDQPVTVQIQLGTDTFEPWGPYSQPTDGNINESANDDVNEHSGSNPRHYVASATYPAGTPITVVGQSWLKNNTNQSGTANSHWYSQRIVDSSAITPQLITLRDGDPVPNILPFLSQPSAVDFVQDYIDFSSNTMDLGPNQAIYLYEMGTTNLTSSAADFQDLVVLVSIEKLPGDFGVTSVTGNVSGQININPNNSPHNEFQLTKSDGTMITRDDLHQSTPIDGSGTFYQGAANQIRVKPKGNGSQNVLLVDGVAYPVENKNTYAIQFGGNVRVYNDQVDSGGNAMGHWWVEFTSGPGTVQEDEGEISTKANLIQVDPKTGTTQHIMPLQQIYEGLAATSAQTFYASKGDGIYQIDPVAKTETLLGTLSASNDMTALEFAGQNIYRHSAINNQFRQLDLTAALELGTEMNLGLTNLGTMVFIRVPDEPRGVGMYD